MKSFWRSERGSAAAEYTLIIAVVSVAIAFSAFGLGSKLMAGLRAGAEAAAKLAPRGAP
jgi:Flp pilus assembly pilin Flp